MEETVDSKKGVLGFVDDYTRWVVSETVDKNMAALQTGYKTMHTPVALRRSCYLSRLSIWWGGVSGDAITVGQNTWSQLLTAN